MGKRICPTENSVDSLVNSLSQQSGQDLKNFFEQLFDSMAYNSKQAVLELSWQQLQVEEQELAQFPVIGRRLAESTIVSRLDGALLTETTTNSNQTNERRPVSTGVGPSRRRRRLADFIGNIYATSLLHNAIANSTTVNTAMNTDIEE